LRFAAVQLATAQHLALGGNWIAANLLSAHSIAELKAATDPLRRALDGARTAGTRTTPFNLEEDNVRVGALEFRFDMERLTGRLQEGQDVPASLTNVADATRDRRWRQESNPNDKFAAITTPYDVDLSLTLNLPGWQIGRGPDKPARDVGRAVS